jgi:hypothetical protein
MKILVENYTFDASARKITFTDYNPIIIERVLLITNVVDNVIIYNFADVTKGGTAATNVLTLNYDTSTMADSDELQIFYDDADTAQPVSLPAATVTTLTPLKPADTLTKVTTIDTVTNVVHIDDNSSTITVDGTVSANATLVAETTKVIGTVNQGTSPWVIGGAVTNTVLSVVGTGTEAAAQRVTIATDSTGVLSIDDNGSSITVDGTFYPATQPISIASAQVVSGAFASGSISAGAIAAGATSFVKLEDVASADADAGVPSMAVRKATPANTSGTDGDYEMLQMSAGRLWISATVDAALPAGTNAIGKLAANSGVDIGDIDILSIAAGDNNIGNVDVVTLPTLANVTTVGTVTTLTGTTTLTPGTGATNLGKAIDTALGATDTGVLALAVRDDTLNIRSGTENDVEPLHTDVVGALWVDPQGNVAHDAADAGNPIKIGGRATAEEQAAVSAANDRTDMSVDLYGNLKNVGNLAHDTADRGNPMKIGAKAITALSGATMVAAADRTDLYADEDGVQIVKLQTTNNDMLVERVSNTDGASTASTVFGATASSYNCITTIIVHNAHASTNCYVDIRDGTAGTILATIPAPANGGTAISFPVPLRQTTANTALAYDVSAAVTTIYITFIGYKSKA